MTDSRPGDDISISEPEIDSPVAIKTIQTAAELCRVGDLLQQVWGTTTPIVSTELLRAVSHSGGYVAGAYAGNNMIGASFGFLGRHGDDLALHSHVTGILPGVRHGGVGRAIKLHQRQWAAARAIPWVTWTFDPLVRRNAWFNIGVLGGIVTEYLNNFYGTMSDSINVGGGDSDRLMIAWSTNGHSSDIAEGIADGQNDGGDSVVEQTVLVPTPDSIVRIRRTDPGAAERWQARLRVELGDRLRAGASVTGFTRAGEYVVALPPTTDNQNYPEQ